MSSLPILLFTSIARSSWNSPNLKALLNLPAPVARNHRPVKSGSFTPLYPSLYPPVMHLFASRPDLADSLFPALHSLQDELCQLMTQPTTGISAFPDLEDFFSWTATIDGPEGTPYANLSFKLSFKFPSNYPYAPPTVLFVTPIYHPNIDFSGRICLDLLKDRWTAVNNVQSTLLSLQSLLGEPNKYVTIPSVWLTRGFRTNHLSLSQRESSQW